MEAWLCVVVCPNPVRSRMRRMSNRQVQHTTPVGRKQKALNDMADNEDWLDGKIKPKA